MTSFSEGTHQLLAEHFHAANDGQKRFNPKYHSHGFHTLSFIILALLE